jgi:hypothetical protein
MTHSNNVISFPSRGVGSSIVNGNPNLIDEAGELHVKFEDNKKLYIDHIVDYYSAQLIDKLGMHGFDIYDDDFIYSFSFTIESLRSTLYQSLGMFHPLIKYIEEAMEKLEDLEDTEKSD